MARMPPATADVTAAVVRRLIRHQRPDLTHLSLVRVANGWDNVTFRLGDELAVRLPRRDEAVPLILHEQPALVLSTAMVSNSDDNPRMFSAGEFGMRQVLKG